MINGKHKAACASYISNQKQIIFFHCIIYRYLHLFIARAVCTNSVNYVFRKSTYFTFQLLDGISTNPRLKTIPAHVTRQ